MSQKYILAMENSYTTGSIFNPLLGFYSNLNPNDLYIMHGSYFHILHRNYRVYRVLENTPNG